MKKSLRSQSNEQKSQGNGLDYTEISRVTSASQQGAIRSNNISPLTCGKLMVAPFKEAFFRGDFTRVHEAMGSEEDKDFRWKVILEEYSYLMKNEDGDHLLQLFEKILVLKHDIHFVQYACYYLSQCNSIGKKHDPEVVERISLLYPGDYADDKTIKLTLTMLGTKEYELSILEDEYKRIQAANGKGEKMTEEGFDMQTVVLSKYLGGGMIKTETTSVTEYASIYQTFITEIKSKRKDGGG